MEQATTRPKAQNGHTSDRKKARLTDEQRDFAEENLPICGIIAKKIAKKCPYIPEDDFHQAAFEGLADAVKGFEESKGVQFASYADRRVVGACLDMMREDGTIRIPRRNRGEGVRFVSISRTLHFTDAGDSVEVEDRLLPADEEPTPAESAESSDAFEAWLRGFNAAERHIVREYVVNGTTMKRIGADLGLSESRVSQMFASILERLRERSNDPRYRLLSGYRRLASA